VNNVTIQAGVPIVVATPFFQSHEQSVDIACPHIGFRLGFIVLVAVFLDQLGYLGFYRQFIFSGRCHKSSFLYRSFYIDRVIRTRHIFITYFHHSLSPASEENFFSFGCDKNNNLTRTHVLYCCCLYLVSCILYLVSWLLLKEVFHVS
jgi:hypothetical protein